MPVPKAVCFDVGWTLVYPRESLWETFAAVAREAGAALTAAEAESLVHRIVEAGRERAVAEFEAGAQYADSDAEFARMFQSLGRLIFGAGGVPGDPAVLTEAFMARFWNRDNWAVFPDVFDGLARLREAGVRTGVLSNAHSTLVVLLDALGLLRHCDFTVVSAIEGTKKPDRRIFERALDRAGVAAAQAVHVGDMYVEDVLGARNAGVRPLLMDRGDRAMFPNHPESAKHPSGDVEVVRTLDDVLAAVGV